MVTKIFLTLLVLLIAYVYLQRRALAAKSTRRRASTERPVKPESGLVGSIKKDEPIKLIAVLFVLVSFVLSLSFFAYRWYDGHQLLNVTLVSPQSSEPLYYQVHKSALQERSFTTTTGQIIRIGAQDRLQIEPLTD
ncbi:hypothetical protein [Amphritea sp.]|uniref:hypothetical protein n=1 Tax=Amphritea sp. TaxID=1872502 RepID=UPI003A8D8AC1